MSACAHCGAPSAAGAAYCCTGCANAHRLIDDLGLGRYYERRLIDPAVRTLRPEEDGPQLDYALHVQSPEPGIGLLHLMVEGIHCAACVWLIETMLGRQPGVASARLNMTTRRLALRWRDGEADPNALVGMIAQLGYRLIPFDPASLSSEAAKAEKELLWSMAVAGFAAGNIMLYSVSVWAGHWQGMGPATRDMMHWISALIALPTIVYAGRPFFRSAFAALRHGRTNMDVPISLGVSLAAGMSLFETIHHGEHAFFDSAVTLLFFLLVGRYLDHRARGRARSAAEQLLGLRAVSATILDESGHPALIRPTDLRQDMVLLVAAGERLAADGVVLDGVSDIDCSLINGESLPGRIGPSERVFAGTLNLSAPLRVRVAAVGEATLLAEIVRMMEVAEQGRARYVALADRVARLYAPVVHVMALATFLGWTLLLDASWQAALLNAVAVLIITCPCALALAVPVVQVIATGRLLRRGILVKSATALERLALVDTVVFDKTGTLTLGRPDLVLGQATDPSALAIAASLAGASRHPLARALCRAQPSVPVALGVEEVPGSGLRRLTPEGEIRLGSRAFCGIAEEAVGADPELWLTRPDAPPATFIFRDALREDAAAIIAGLRGQGLGVELLSGDNPAAARAVAAAAGIDIWRAACSPAAKCARLDELAGSGRKVLMVGDGLNDAPALAAALVSLSPSTAVDVSQTAADAVFQGARLAPVLEILATSRRCARLVRQNFALALVYNAVFVPLAVAGLVTPLLAAIAMSTSSLLVITNALRLNRRGLR